MVIDFKGKTALVTGGAGGIGMAVVKNMLDSNAKVAVVDVSDKALDAAKQELEGMGSFKCYKLDITKVEDIANGVVFLASDKAAMITGQTLIIDGGSSIVGY